VTSPRIEELPEEWIDSLREIWARQVVKAAAVDPEEQWVRGVGLAGGRLAALERRGLIETQDAGASFNLSRRYDVVWRLTPAGSQALAQVEERNG
jgi:hypothetical protein